MSQGLVCRRITLMFLAISLIGGGCGKKRGGEEGAITVSTVPPSSAPDKRAAAKASLPLAVALATPQGAISGGESVSVLFNQPMVPLAAVPDELKLEWINLTPERPGTWRWVGDRAVVFAPRDGFAPSTRYEVTVGTGARSLAGMGLAKDFSYSFSTPPPKVAWFAESLDRAAADLQPDLPIFFNQRVRQADLEARLSLKAGDQAVQVRVRRPSLDEVKASGLAWQPYHEATGEWVWDASSANPAVLSRILDELALQGFVITPVEALPRAETIRLVIGAGLAGEGGNLGTQADEVFSFSTYGPLELVRNQFEPRYEPTSTWVLHFSNPLDEKGVAPSQVTLKPAVPDLRLAVQGRQLELTGRFAPDTSYQVMLGATLKDRFGQSLGAGQSTMVATDHVRPDLDLGLARTGVVEREGRVRELPVSWINLKTPQAQWTRLDAENLVPFLTATDVWASDTDALSGRAGVMHWSFDGAFKPDEWQSHALPLAMDHGPFGGAFFFQVHEQDYHPHDAARPFFQRALYNVTDLGLVAKPDGDGVHLAVFSLKSGQPVADAALEVRNASNQVVWKGRSAAEGFVEARLGELGTDDPGSLYFTAAQGDDFTWLRLDWSTRLELWNLGLHPQEGVPTKRIVLWPEKELFRKGETVHVTGVIREFTEGTYRVPTGEVLKVRVVNPNSDVVLQKQLVIMNQGAARYGTFELPVDIKPTWLNGAYSVIVEGTGVEERCGFEVAAYRKPTFRVATSASALDVYPGETVGADAEARYYFGAVLARGEATWRATSSEDPFEPPGFEEYSFHPQPAWGEAEESETRALFDGLVLSERALTDEQGRTHLSLSIPPGVRTSKKVVLEAEVRDLSGHPITGATTVRLHPAAAYLGLKVDRYFYGKGEQVLSSFVAVTPVGEATFGRKVDLSLLRQEWVKETRKGLGQALDESWHAVLTPVGEAQTFVSGDGPIEVPWAPDKPGSYVLRGTATDKLGREAHSEAYFYVLGDGRQGWYGEDEAGFKLLPEKGTVKVGERARILVKAPFVGVPAILTVERERVMSQRNVVLDSSMQVLEVEVTPEMVPNAYVSLTVPRGRLGYPRAEEADGLYRPGLKLGYCKLAVDTSERRFAVDVAAEKADYRSGDTVRLNLKAPEKASLVVAAVDRAVLELTGYQPPDLHARFYEEFPLGVRTHAVHQRLVSQAPPRTRGGKPEQAKGDEAGGDGGGRGVPFRKDFRDVAFYTGVLETDDTGAATASFELPDNLTEYRVMVTAVNATDRFGKGEASFRVSKPFLLLPTVPRVVALDDRFTFSLEIRNSTGQAGKGTLQVLAPAFMEVQPGPREFALDAQASAVVEVSLAARAAGEGPLQVEASFAGETDRLSVPLVARSRYPVEETAFFNSGTESGGFDVLVPNDVVPEVGGLEYGVANTGFVNLAAAFSGLMDYPYGCTEQLSSRLVAHAMALTLEPVNQSLHRSRESLVAAANGLVNQVLARQEWSGGFRFWDRGQEDPYVSAYAFLALGEAMKAGAEVPVARLDRAYEYLMGQLNLEAPAGLTEHVAAHSLKSFILYAVSRSGRPTRNLEDVLIREQEPTPEARLYLAAVLADRKGLGDVLLKTITAVLNQVVVDPEDAHVEPRGEFALAFSSRATLTAMLMECLVKLDSGHTLLPKLSRWLVKVLARTHQVSTHEGALGLMALSAYFTKLEKDVADFDVAVELDGKELMRDHLAGRRPDVYTDLVGMQSLKPGKAMELTFDRTGTGRFYYHARLQYAPRTDLTRVAPKAQGFLVSRRAFTLDGHPVLDRVKRGQAYVVELDVANTEQRAYMVLTDPLPAGVEAVNLDFATVSPALKRAFYERTGAQGPGEADFQEIGEDEVRFFVDSLEPGLHRYFYLARAVHRGEYRAPGAKAAEMYNAENFGSTSGSLLKVE
jgi:uncharacterized protein YfaS (alpha-2-macroglobulin family)